MEAGKTIVNIEKLTIAIGSDTKVSRYEMAAELEFAANVLQVVNQTYEMLCLVLMRATLLTPDDVASDAVKVLIDRTEKMVGMAYYTELEVVKNRLRALHEGSRSVVERIMDRFPNACDWNEILDLIDERKSSLIDNMKEVSYDLIQDLQRLRLHPHELGEVRKRASTQANLLREVLQRSQRLSNWILGLPSAPVETAAAAAGRHG